MSDVKQNDEEKPEPEEAKPEAAPADMVNIVTTAIGTFGIGIVAIGSHATIKPEAFSANWMRAKTMGDRNKLVAAGKLPKPEPKGKEKVAE